MALGCPPDPLGKRAARGPGSGARCAGGLRHPDHVGVAPGFTNTCSMFHRRRCGITLGRTFPKLLRTGILKTWVGSQTRKHSWLMSLWILTQAARPVFESVVVQSSAIILSE